MLQDENNDLRTLEGSSYLTKNMPIFPIMVCAALSVFLFKGGLLSLFFLVPLGYAAVVYGSFWLIFSISTALNIILALMRQDVNEIGLYVVHVAIVSLGFLWIMTGKYTRIRTLYRFIISSSVVASFLIFFIRNNLYKSEIFLLLGSEEAESFVLFNTVFTQETLFDWFVNIISKGGAIASALFQFYVSYYVVYLTIKIVKKKSLVKPLASFFIPYNTFMVFLFALATVVMTGFMGMQFLDIIAWNVFIVCGILFLTQGAGILLYLMSRKTRGFRIAVILLIIVMMLSPISVIGFALLLLLGITEYWVAFRGKGQVSTPEI